MKLEGKILGFDEFMNIVLDDAEEVYKDEKKERRALGTYAHILRFTLIFRANSAERRQCDAYSSSVNLFKVA